MGIKRRDFLKQSALLVSAAQSKRWLTGAVAAQETDVLQTADHAGQETWKNTVCHLCPGGCGIRVRLIDERPVAIAGNPISPINHGGLCPTGQSGLQHLFDSDRISGPLKRVGKKGVGEWQTISWPAALQIVSEKLLALRKAGHPHHVAFFQAGMRGSMARLVRQFMNAYGSPNIIATREENPYALPFLMMHGKSARPAYDYLNSRFVLSFGKDFLGTEGPPAWMANIFGEIRQPHRGFQPHFVQVSSRFSMSSAKADKWVPIIPGTGGALALGIAYIMIIENLYDQQFVENFTFGFNDWRDKAGRKQTGFKNTVLKQYYPEKVAKITGVSVDVIIQLARRFGGDKPSIAIYGEEVTNHTNRFYSQIAIHALNALSGTLNKKGGIFMQPEEYPSSFSPVSPDLIARKGLKQPRLDQQSKSQNDLPEWNLSQVLQNLAEEKPYPLELAFVYQSNPVFELPKTNRIKQVFTQIPFLVSFASYMDETTELADLILPDHTYLEKWDLDFEIPNIPFMYSAVSQPVVEPVLNTRQAGDVIIQLARRIEPLSRAVPFQNYPQLIRSEVKALYNSGLGFIPNNDFERFMYTYMLDRGFKYHRAENFKQFWQELLTHDGWLEIPVEKREGSSGFQTPSGKFEFASQILQEKFKSHLSTVIDKEPRSGLKLLPHYEPAEFFGARDHYPLYFVPYHLITLFNGEEANRPLLLEMVGYSHQIRWNSWAEINPETAREWEINDGARIWLESAQGKIKVRVKYFSGAMPGIVYIPLGLGHTAYGHYAKNRGVNPNRILALQADRFSGQLVQHATRVRINKRGTSDGS